MDHSYYKILLKHGFFRTKVHLNQTDKKGKLFISIFGSLGLINFIIFNYTQFIIFLEYTETYIAKSYISLPIAITITWAITYVYHRKNKPVQDFWNTKRQETIDDLIVYARQSAADIRTAEELQHQEKPLPVEIRDNLMQNDLLVLKQITDLNYNYLTHKEVRQLGLYITHVAHYFRFLSRTTNSQIQIHNLETSIIIAESMLVDLLISFRITDRIIIDALTRPLSRYHVNDNIIQRRKILKNRTQRMLL